MRRPVLLDRFRMCLRAMIKWTENRKLFSLNNFQKQNNKKFLRKINEVKFYSEKKNNYSLGAFASFFKHFQPLDSETIYSKLIEFE